MQKHPTWGDLMGLFKCVFKTAVTLSGAAAGPIGMLAAYHLASELTNPNPSTSKNADDGSDVGE